MAKQSGSNPVSGRKINPGRMVFPKASSRPEVTSPADPLPEPKRRSRPDSSSLTSSASSTGALVKSPGQRLRALLARPDAAALVPQIPVLDLYLLIRQVGLSDCVELLELAQLDQIQRMMDIDIWQKDELNLEPYVEWLSAVAESRPERLREVLEDLDVEVLVYFLQEHVAFHHIDPDDREEQKLALEGRNVVETPDNQYFMEFAPDDPLEEFIRLLIDRLYTVDVQVAHWLIESCRWELPSQLQETAFRLRSGRMEELGFLPYHEALAIYQPLPSGGKPFPRHAPSSPPAESTLLAPQTLFREGLFLSQAMERYLMRYPDTLEDAFLLLANRVLVAERRDPSDHEALREVLEIVRSTVSLGLELHSQGDLEVAVKVLAEVHLEWLFRRGLTETMGLRKRASRLAEKLRPSLRYLPGPKADAPVRDVVEGLAHFRPVFFKGLSDPAAQGYEPFQSLGQCQQTEACLLDYERVQRFVFQFLAVDVPTISMLKRSLVQQDLGLTPRSAFLTTLAQKKTGGLQTFEPIGMAAFGRFLELAFEEKSGPGPVREVSSSLQQELDALLAQYCAEVDKEAEEALKKFVQDSLDALREDYGALEPQSDLRPELVGGPIYLEMPVKRA